MVFDPKPLFSSVLEYVYAPSIPAVCEGGGVGLFIVDLMGSSDSTLWGGRRFPTYDLIPVFDEK